MSANQMLVPYVLVAGFLSGGYVAHEFFEAQGLYFVGAGIVGAVVYLAACLSLYGLWRAFRAL
ncbi:hypothetical protein [Achromobacter sp. DH1f]|uniref:hypothetical protein n=1 Tax=Achromobacter sp. DH1f TaxID=1397275 RepID=UPI0012FF4F83|nr:hypothetical protein [Achromobacter sp. DH1f]